MRVLIAEKFADQLAAAPPDIQRAFGKQLGQLVRYLRHPSLRAKKYDEARGLWQARVNGGWRFYFRIEGDMYVLETIQPHPK